MHLRPHRTLRLTLTALLTCCAVLAQNSQYAAQVIGVSDGDTIKVLHDGVPKRIRLWGIDSPELKQPFSARARQFTGDLAFGQAVKVVVRDVDRYGRQVAEVILPDGRNLNEEVVRAGFAWWFVRYARRDQVFGNLEAEARAARRGLWADAAPAAPWEFRRNGSRRMADDQADAGTVVRAGVR